VPQLLLAGILAQLNLTFTQEGLDNLIPEVFHELFVILKEPAEDACRFQNYVSQSIETLFLLMFFWLINLMISFVTNRLQEDD